jgi:hypothetical protein
MSRYLDLARRGSCELAKREKCELVATPRHNPPSPQPEAATNSHNSHFASSRRPYARLLATLEARCPEHVDVPRWQQAVADARSFLSEWGEQARALGWTARDLFGLHSIPDKPHPSYRRLSRYDCTGLIWLLQSRRITAMTETTAAIQNVTGNVTAYRKDNKPALGPLGDSLDGFMA